MIPSELLAATEGRAPGICVYGLAGLKKSHVKHTLPPPILDHDFEGGQGSYAPWIRRWRNFNETRWHEVSQETRESKAALLQIPDDQRSKISPAPLIDTIVYDSFNPESYDHFIQQVGNTPTDYNSVCVDSLQELSFDIQVYGKAKAGMGVDDMMHVKVWAGVQERNAIAIRRLRDYRMRGIFVYLIASEAIEKSYVTDPRSSEGKPPDPYATKGSINVPGQLVNVIPGLVDIQLRTRTQNGVVVLVRKQESVAPGVFWETKDRWGRLPDFSVPSVYTMCTHLYGKEGARAIYEYATAQVNG